MTVKRVVIDTNILISSILSPHGSPARVMELISDKEVQLVYTSAILAEYKRVPPRHSSCPLRVFYQPVKMNQTNDHLPQ